MTIVSLDPGFTGGVCVFKDNIPTVFRMPVKTVKGKNKYDIEALVDLLAVYVEDKPHVGIESVFSMPGQGLSSTGALLEGKGIIIGICAALYRKEPLMVPPPSWKKMFPQLTNTPELVSIKEEMKKLKDKQKSANDKSLKKEISKLHSSYKSKVKTRTRELAASMYPDIADEFKLIRDDGKADALFIGLYTMQKYV